MKFFLFLFPVLLVYSSCTSSHEENQLQKHIWTTKDISYYINKQANKLSESAIQYSFKKWQMHTDFIFHYAGRHTAGLKKDGKNTVSFLTKWPSDIPFEKIAYTKCWYNPQGHIIEADIIFNMQLAKFTTLQTNTKEAYTIEGVLVHEIGHLLGLDHITNDTSVMKYKSTWQESFFKGAIDTYTLQAFHDLYQ